MIRTQILNAVYEVFGWVAGVFGGVFGGVTGVFAGVFAGVGGVFGGVFAGGSSSSLDDDEAILYALLSNIYDIKR